MKVYMYTGWGWRDITEQYYIDVVQHAHLGWRDVDQACQRFGGDFDINCRRLGLDPEEVRRQKQEELQY